MTTLSLVLTAITQLTPIFVKLVRLYTEAKRRGWVEDGRELAIKIEGAVTDEERMRLARDLFGSRAK